MYESLVVLVFLRTWGVHLEHASSHHQSSEKNGPTRRHLPGLTPRRPHAYVRIGHIWYKLLAMFPGLQGYLQRRPSFLVCLTSIFSFPESHQA